MIQHWQRRWVFSIALAAASAGLAGCSDDSDKPAAKTAEEALGIQDDKGSRKTVEATHDVTVVEERKVIDNKTGEVISAKKEVTPVRITQEKEVKSDVKVKVGDTQSTAK